jgi:hypothetical protein
MFTRPRTSIARALLIIMLVTLLSPAMGWGMVASHEQLSHGAESHDIETSHHDEHQQDQHRDEDHQQAHSSVGHLFTHLPIDLFIISTLAIQPQIHPKTSFMRPAFVTFAVKPPFRPPKPTASF